MTGRALPLQAWAGVLGVASVTASAAVTGLVLVAVHAPAGPAVTALAAGATAGLAVVAFSVVLAGRLADALRALRHEALRRLQEPSAAVPRPAAHSAGARATRELAGLASVIEALHLRVRLGDQVGQRHRDEAETAGAGVFELLSDLVAAEEATRGQLSAELHDTVAQSLMIARRLLAEGPATPADLARLGDYVEDAEEQVRAVMARTRPPALRDGDLADAVGMMRLDMQARYALEVDVVWPGAAYPLPLASAVTVYRFFQEALLNVVKHADVDRAEIVLSVEEDVVRARVSDLGPGFDPSLVKPERGRHVGLGLLRERARISGGRLDLHSEVGVGTTLTLVLPRPSAAAVQRQTASPALELVG